MTRQWHTYAGFRYIQPRPGSVSASYGYKRPRFGTVSAVNGNGRQRSGGTSAGSEHNQQNLARSKWCKPRVRITKKVASRTQATDADDQGCIIVN